MAAVEAETPPKTLDRSSFFQLRFLSSSQSLKKWSPETLTSDYRKPMRSESMNIKSRKRFFLCFRPVAMDEPLTSDRQPSSGDKVFAYIPVTDKGDSIVPIISLPLSEKKEKKKEEDESSKIYARNNSGRRKRRSARRIFSAIVNAVSFDTKLKRKLRNLRNRKVRQDPYRPDVSQEAKTSCISPCQKISDDDDRNAISSVSSSASSSRASFSSASRTSTSSTSSSAGKTNHSRSNSLEVKQNDRSVGSIQSKSKKKRVSTGFYRSCYGLLLILISFSFVIFWGRLYAILCTSAWLYLAPRRIPESHLREDIDSPEHKKKVIMEGLLERSRSHRANC